MKLQLGSLVTFISLCNATKGRYVVQTVKSELQVLDKIGYVILSSKQITRKFDFGLTLHLLENLD